jgi:DnaJ family protein C protein 28
MVSVDDTGDIPDWTAGVAERKIQDAIQEGLFDNLPGRGQPLDLSVNPFEPPGMGAINRLLKHNKVLPPWLMLEQEIEASRALALGALARWEASAPGLRDAPEYPRRRAQAREAYARHLKETNDLILKYNYSSPFAFRAPIPFMRNRRLAEFDAAYGTDAGASGEAAP